MGHSTDTDSTTDADNTCLPEMGLSLVPQVGPVAHFSFQKTLKGPRGSVFFLSVTQVVENSVSK